MNKNNLQKPNSNIVGVDASHACDICNSHRSNSYPNIDPHSKGITLIALIITIIVMLILVAVSITIAINGGLFDTTKRAAKETEEAKNLEQDLASGRIKIDGIWYDSLEDYAIGKESDIQGVVDLDKSNTQFIYEPEGWTNGEVKVKINTTAQVAGFTLQYSTDNIKWENYTTEIPMSINGVVYAKLVDIDGKEGGIATGNVENIDKQVPTVNTSLNSTGAIGTDIPLSINVTDTLSGISKIEWYYKLDTESSYKSVTDNYVAMNGKERGEKTAVTKETTLSDLAQLSTYNIYAIVYDVAGNSTRSPETGTINVTTQKPEDMDLTAYNKATKDANGLLLANVIVTYRPTGITATVPKGFKIVEGIEGTKSITDGLVIQDIDGNEFVWIPVEVTEDDTETSIASFYRSEWANNARGASLTDSTTFTEPYANGYEGEAEEYEEMLKSVYENKGFYIGRYEAGSVTERTSIANGTTEMVVKKNQYPYNYVSWGASMTDYTSDVASSGKGAVYLSKKMYEGKDVGVTSTLCYGIQWDAMLDFIKDDNHNVTNGSTSWGSYDSLQLTGSSELFAVKNIFDVQGNVAEFTMEAENNRRVLRGANFKINRIYYYAAVRDFADVGQYYRI